MSSAVPNSPSGPAHASSILAPGTPGSPVSRVPSPSTSQNTRSPMVTVPPMPNSSPLRTSDAPSVTPARAGDDGVAVRGLDRDGVGTTRDARDGPRAAGTRIDGHLDVVAPAEHAVRAVPGHPELDVLQARVVSVPVAVGETVQVDGAAELGGAVEPDLHVLDGGVAHGDPELHRRAGAGAAAVRHRGPVGDAADHDDPVLTDGQVGELPVPVLAGRGREDDVVVGPGLAVGAEPDQVDPLVGDRSVL